MLSIELNACILVVCVIISERSNNRFKSYLNGFSKQWFRLAFPVMKHFLCVTAGLRRALTAFSKNQIFFQPKMRWFGLVSEGIWCSQSVIGVWRRKFAGFGKTRRVHSNRFRKEHFFRRRTWPLPWRFSHALASALALSDQSLSFDDLVLDV